MIRWQLVIPECASAYIEITYLWGKSRLSVELGLAEVARNVRQQEEFGMPRRVWAECMWAEFAKVW